MLLNNFTPGGVMFAHTLLEKCKTTAPTSDDVEAFFAEAAAYSGSVEQMIDVLENHPSWRCGLGGAVCQQILAHVNWDRLSEKHEENLDAFSLTVGVVLPHPADLYVYTLNSFGKHQMLFTCEHNGDLFAHDRFNGGALEWLNALQNEKFDPAGPQTVATPFVFGGTTIYMTNHDTSTPAGKKPRLPNVIDLIHFNRLSDLETKLQEGRAGVRQGLQDGSFLTVALNKGNMEAVKLLLNAGAPLTTVTDNLPVYLKSFDSLIAPILEHTRNESLLSACITWQMGMAPSVVKPHHRDFLFALWNETPHKERVLLNAASCSEGAWRSAPWNTQLRTVAAQHPDMFAGVLNVALEQGLYGFVRETLRELKTPPSAIAVGSTNLLAYAEQLVQRPSDFRPSSAQRLNPVASFAQAVRIMEAQFGQSVSKKISP